MKPYLLALTHPQTCQPLVNNNNNNHFYLHYSGRRKRKEEKRKIWRPMKKNLEMLQKIVRFYFFSRSNLFSIERTRHQPHSQGLLPFQNGGQTRRKTISCLNTRENHNSVQKSRKYSFFPLLVYHFMALVLRYVPDWTLVRFKFLMISITQCPRW